MVMGGIKMQKDLYNSSDVRKEIMDKARNKLIVLIGRDSIVTDMLLNEEFEDKFEEFITWLAGEIEFSLAYPSRVIPTQPNPQPRPRPQPRDRPYYTRDPFRRCV